MGMLIGLVIIFISIGIIAAFVRHTQLMGNGPRDGDNRPGDSPKPGDEKYKDFFGGSSYGSRGLWH